MKVETSEILRASLRSSPEEYQVPAEEFTNPTLENWTEEHFPGLISNFGIILIHDLVGDERMASYFFRMKWWIWDFSPTGCELLLSDKPIVLTGNLTDPDAIVALPISPLKAFMGTQSEKTALILREQSPKVLATRLNETSLGQAGVRVIAQSSQPQRFIENRHFQRQRT